MNIHNDVVTSQQSTLAYYGQYMRMYCFPARLHPHGNGCLYFPESWKPGKLVGSGVVQVVGLILWSVY